MKTITLDERIAAALATEPSASELLALVIEVTTAIDDADAAGRIARAQSIDPKCADGIAARGRAEDTEFCAARLRAGLAELQRAHADVQAREEAAAWRVDADKVQELRDALVTRFVRDYPVAVAGLVDLFAAVVACDCEVDRINRTAPDLENSHRLRRVEAAARGNDGPITGDMSILGMVRLPNLNQFALTMAWPPKLEPINLAMLNGFAKNGTPGAGDGDLYEPAIDDDGFYTMRRRADAPPLNLVAPPVMDVHEQIAAEQQARRVEDEQRAQAGLAREREKEARAAAEARR
jgi:hypothetical protein